MFPSVVVAIYRRLDRRVRRWAVPSVAGCRFNRLMRAGRRTGDHNSEQLGHAAPARIKRPACDGGGLQPLARGVRTRGDHAPVIQTTPRALSADGACAHIQGTTSPS